MSKEIFSIDNKTEGFILGSSLIPPHKIYATLRELAANSLFLFEGKELVLNLFGEATFHLEASTDGVKGYLTSFDKVIDVASLSFLFQGPPHGFIYGRSLKFIASGIPWKLLKKLKEVRVLPLEELALYEDIPIRYLDGVEHVLQAAIEPTPLLILKDRMGAFANLYMQYRNQKILFQDPQQDACKRLKESELNWEKDLLETGFIKKQGEGAHYFCPVDKVSESLQFLLEVGWQILDREDKPVLLNTGHTLHLEEKSNYLIFQGDFLFGEHKALAKELFSCQENFISLGDNAVGLMPSQKTLQTLFEACEMVGEEIRLKKSSFSLAEDLVRSTPNLYHLLKLLPKEASFTPPGSAFQAILRPYQQEGLNWLISLYQNGFHGLLADDMGLGKTVQLIAFLSKLNTEKPVLIIAPTSLLTHWKKEFETHLPTCPVHIYHGPQRVWSETAKVHITSYALLRLDLALLETIDFECVILDEAQTIKNAKTKAFSAACRLSTRFRLSLTGTPIENKLEELWTHFHFLIPDLLGSLATFSKFSTSKIKKLVRPFLLKRKKEDVAKDLPPKISEVVFVTMEEEQKQAYDTFLSSFKGKITLEGIKNNRMQVLEAILRLRQLACHPFLVSKEAPSAKLEALLDDLETIQEEGSKALIFSQFTSMLDLIGNALKEKNHPFVRLDGTTKNRELPIQAFQEDPNIPFFLISLKAGGVGLNLTAADYVCLFDPWWNEAVENQAIDRAHRIGQTKTVFARRYVTIDTIEEKIMALKKKKATLVEDLFEKDLPSSLTEDDLLFLLDLN